MNPNCQEIKWISGLRVMSMFSVIMLHTASPLLLQRGVFPMTDWIFADVYNAISRYCVPVFVMITGALLLHRDHQLTFFLQKRIGNILFPFLFWSFIYIIYSVYVNRIPFSLDYRNNIILLFNKVGSDIYANPYLICLIVAGYFMICFISPYLSKTSEQSFTYIIFFTTIFLSAFLFFRSLPSGYTGYILAFIWNQLKNGSYYHLWYIYMLIGLYLTIPILSKFTKHANKKEKIYFLTIWFISILITKPYFSELNPSINLNSFSGYIGYLVLGHFLVHEKISLSGSPTFPWLIFFSFVIIISSGTYYTNKSDDNNTIFYEPLGPFVVLLSLCVFLIAKQTVMKFNKVVRYLIEKADRHLFGIYLCHALVLSLLNILGFNFTFCQPVVSIPLVSIICFLITWALVFCLSKLPLFKYAIGERALK
jgi:surface polysaccharide O-acyltransferase-like enzyme